MAKEKNEINFHQLFISYKNTETDGHILPGHIKHKDFGYFLLVGLVDSRYSMFVFNSVEDVNTTLEQAYSELKNTLDFVIDGFKDEKENSLFSYPFKELNHVEIKSESEPKKESRPATITSEKMYDAKKLHLYDFIDKLLLKIPVFDKDMNLINDNLRLSNYLLNELPK